MSKALLAKCAVFPPHNKCHTFMFMPLDFRLAGDRFGWITSSISNLWNTNMSIYTVLSDCLSSPCAFWVTHWTSLHYWGVMIYHDMMQKCENTLSHIVESNIVLIMHVTLTCTHHTPAHQAIYLEHYTNTGKGLTLLSNQPQNLYAIDSSQDCFEILAHVDMIALQKTCRIFSCTWMQLHAMNLLCDMVQHNAGSSHYKMGKLWPIRGARDLQQFSDRLWLSSNDWHVLRGWSVPRRHSPLHCTSSTILAYRQREVWVHRLMLLGSYSRNQTNLDLPVYNCPVLVSLCSVLSVLGWLKWNPSWSFAVVFSVPKCFPSHYICSVIRVTVPWSQMISNFCNTQ